MFDFYKYRVNLSISHKRNDLYDRAMFIEATETNVLVTDDNPFLNTCNLIPCKRYDVMNLENFKSMVLEKLSLFCIIGWVL